MGAIENRIIEGVAWLPLLQGLAPDVVARLATGAALHSVPRGTEIFRQGQPGSGLYAIRHGQVKLSLEGDDGQEKVFDLLGPNACFGEPSLYLQKPHLVTAMAISDTDLVHLDRSTLLRELTGNAELACRVITQLAERLYRRAGDVKSYMLMSGTQRVICFLLHEMPFDCVEGGEVELPARKGIIASRLNLTQEHFSRILRELVSSDLIRVRGQMVRIVDMEGLRAKAFG